MTDWLGAEAIVDAIVVKLQANMSTRIGTINTEFDDDVTLSVPDDTRYFKSALRLIPPPGPAILVMDGPMTILPRSEGPHSLLTSTLIGVWAMDEDSSEDKLARRIRRLSRAVIECVWDSDPAEMLVDDEGNQIAYDIKPHSTVPGDAFEPQHADGPGLREFYCTIFQATRIEG